MRTEEVRDERQAGLLRVVVVDGRLTRRVGLEELLDKADSVCVVGETGDGDEVLRLVRETRPDVVVLGLDLTGETDAAEVCREMKSLPEAPRVLLHTACDFTGEVLSCLLAGADGFLHKRADQEELLNAMRRVAAGKQVWELGGETGELPNIRALLEKADLTPRGREVLDLVIRRYSNPEIAEKLHICRQTVKNHVSNILRKMNVESRKELRRLFGEVR